MKTIIRNGVSKELNNDQIFNSVKVEYGTVVWKNGFDLCPVFLRDYQVNFNLFYRKWIINKLKQKFL